MGLARERRVLAPPQARVGDEHQLELAPPHACPLGGGPRQGVDGVMGR